MSTEDRTTLWDVFPGRKVVCVVGTWLRAHLQPMVIFPRKDVVYTVRDVGEYWHPQVAGFGVGIRLVEITNAPQQYADGYNEISFGLQGFRPLDERATDISSLTALLQQIGRA